jgi:glycosyltransferase involved in cell wall biosynthesis/2-polyprenyl-3-methyl-5-hydroxy-6-metoxy-1,4-benzoquinol methylase
MKKIVQQLGYIIDPVNNIWISPSYQGIAYSDGDEVETRIASIIQKTTDISILSAELRQHCTDWPTLYHLSGTRANIMRPFESNIKGDVLEIGAGCGAITRYLGECGANVLALEGSPRRAAIARSRTRELENVTVLAEKFDHFKCDKKFDVITLVGVLEYANLFTSGENPHLEMLARLSALLKPDGKLIIAIENQLGLKYFAGAPEDHLGQPMIGIEGRYRKDQPQTFGRKVLSGMLEKVGFTVTEFLAPFPDYKFPVSIITEEGFTNQNFDAAAFAWQSVRRDQQLPIHCNFALELAWPVIFENDLGLDMANSFLIIVSNNVKQLSKPMVLAYHYSTDRIAQYCKETKFKATEFNSIDVDYRPLYSIHGSDGSNKQELITFACPELDKYCKGYTLSWEFIQIVTKDGWSIEEVGEFLNSYISVIKYILNITDFSLDSLDVRLPSKYFDLTPQNIIFSEDGKPVFIDTEWLLNDGIELGHLLFRGLLWMMSGITRYGKNSQNKRYSCIEFIQLAISAVGFVLTKEQIMRFIDIESSVQEKITGGSMQELFEWRMQQELVSDNINQAVDEYVGQIETFNQTIIGQDAQLEAYRLQAVQFDDLLRTATIEHDKVNQQVVSMSGQIAELNQTIVERDEQLESYRLQAGQFDDLLRSTIKEHDKVNQQVVSQNGQIAELNQTIVEQDQQLEAYRLQLEQFDSLLCTANTQIESLNQTIAIRDNDIAVLSAKKSWSVIKPIRDLFSVKNANRPAVESLGKHAIVLDTLPEDFDGDSYLKLNDDLFVAGVDPAIHYLKFGQHEGREYRLTELDATDLEKQLPEDFDGDLYLKLNPDLAEMEVDPFIHYLRHGHSEGRIYKLIEVDDQLPEDFDGDTYLKLNVDLVAVGIDPAKHYSRFGRREERIYKLPELDVSGEHEIKSERETILVVSHEASRTGAPILSLNLVQSFVGPYNVVALLLGGGPLSDDFLLSGAAVVNAHSLRGNPAMASHVVEQLCERFKFKFALVNSIESRFVLPQLSEHFIPTISLIHEFASYTRPRNAFRETLFWSAEVVFSANVTKENAFNEYPDLSAQAVHTIPQGRCLLPFSEANEEASQTESLHIQRLMRPKGLADDAVIVLGAGSVQIRKGVDLFIECATRVLHLPGGEKCRFVWVGNGYNPENDLGYSVYLADQIRRAGIQAHFVFIDETSAIETAYQEADMLLLSSRLDPLPNVAIDAMVLGVPVLCFDKTTGIADFLIEIGLGSQCVADYIDSTNMAEKILALATSTDLREAVGEQCQQASIAFFDMTRYVASLESLAKMAGEGIKQEQADTQTILDSGLFRQRFSASPHNQNQAIERQIRLYVREWASGIGRRKPFPGFHPGIYLEQHGLTNKGSDPFADYLRAGQPQGPWTYPVIEANELEVDNLPDNHRVALHIHVYYPELLPEIMMRLSSNQICPDLFVSITDEKNRQLVVEALKEYKGNIVDIQLVPNRGRDIGPFLTAFGHKILANYDFVGHIHTKKSVDIKDASVGETWRQFLLEHLLGGESGVMADNILSRLHNDASVGLVFPDDPYIVGWEANLSIAKPLAQKLGFENLPEHFVFPVGTMFWAKTAALAPLINLNLDWEDYPEEPLPYDGSLLHAIERLFFLCPLLNNMQSATTHVIGLTR